jgi:hypothetical protein
MTEGPTLAVRKCEITYSEEWGGDLSPTGQPGFNTLLSFLKKQNIRINIYGCGMKKNKTQREPVLRIRIFLGLLDPDVGPSGVVRIRILLSSSKNTKKKP